MTSGQNPYSEGSLKTYLSDMSSFNLLSRSQEIEAFQLLYVKEDEYLKHLLSRSPVTIPVLKDAQTRIKVSKNPDKRGIAILRSVLRYLEAGKERRAADRFVEGARRCDSVRSLQIPIHERGREIKDGFGPYDSAHNQWLRRANVLLGRMTDAKNQIASCNLRLVVMWANRYRGKRGKLSMSDMIQEGNFGLLRAIDKFDVTRENRFSTYASWWIRQSIRRAAADTSRTVRIPVHILEKLSKLSQEESCHLTKTGKEMTREEAAQWLGTTPEKLDILRRSRVPALSLDVSAGEDYGETFVNVIEDPNAEDPEAYVELRKLRQDLDRIMKGLTSMEDYIIRKRFGMDGDKPQTLNQIAGKYGLSRERIRQLEARALKKMRTRNGTLSQHLPGAAESFPE